MKVLLAYILLFLYTLTCTGASVYMHHCSAGAFTLSQESSTTNCPLCKKMHNKQQDDQKTNKHACADKDDCCKDLKIDLKKGQQDTENAANAFSFVSLAPAIATIHWIINFQSECAGRTLGEIRDNTSAHNATSPPYLKHCSFRI